MIMESKVGYELVHTCGICEEICNQEDIEKHACIEGYPFYTIDSETLYFYPSTDDGVTVRQSEVNNTEQLVEEPLHYKNENIIRLLQKPEKRKVFEQLENNAKKRTKLNENTGNKLNFDDEELIILEVQKRRPLWDYSLPLVQRKHKIKQKLWAEISLELNGKVNADGVQKKFKSLHDTYRKIIQSEQQPSGSARKDIVQKWAHYESMNFLKDYYLSKTMMSNINTEDYLIPNSSLINDEDDIESIQTDSSGEKQKNKKNGVPKSAMDKIADALSKEPEPPELDEVDSFSALLGFRLRKMSSETMLKTMQRILQLTYEILVQEENE